MKKFGALVVLFAVVAAIAFQKGREASAQIQPNPDGGKPGASKPTKPQDKKPQDKKEAPGKTATKTEPPKDELSKNLDMGLAAAKDLWNKAEKQGRPYAEELVKKMPGYNKGAQAKVQELMAKVEKGEYGKTAQEKQQMVTQLWQLQKCVNVMALLDPQVLKKVVGIDSVAVQEMQKKLKITESKLEKAKSKS